MKVIVSNYAGTYEAIHTVEARSMFLLKLKYWWKGYRVWQFPSIRVAMFLYKHFKINVYRECNVTFEKYIPGTDQVTHWSPYDNFR